MIEYSPSNPSDVLSRFLCPVCRDVVIKPKMTPCEHVFCQKCLKLWLENSSSCPLCRHAVQLSEAKTPPRQFHAELSRLRVRCSFNSKGCSEEMELGKLGRHEKVCRFRGPRCSSNACKRPLQHSDDSEEPGKKIRKFCCKSCLEEHVMHNYIEALKRIKNWKKLATIYESKMDIVKFISA